MGIVSALAIAFLGAGVLHAEGRRIAFLAAESSVGDMGADDLLLDITKHLEAHGLPTHGD